MEVRHPPKTTSPRTQAQPRTESGKYIDTIQFGASTISLIFRSAVTLHSM
jgi:hypothetical protein